MVLNPLLNEQKIIPVLLNNTGVEYVVKQVCPCPSDNKLTMYVTGEMLSARRISVGLDTLL